MYNKEKDIPTFKRRIRFLLTAARARELKNPTAGNTQLILSEAKDLQMAVLKRVEIDSRGDIEEEKRQLSTILCALAKVKSTKEPAVAANLYSEALIHCPRDPTTLLALAKLCAQVKTFYTVFTMYVHKWHLQSIASARFALVSTIAKVRSFHEDAPHHHYHYFVSFDVVGKE